MANRTHSGTATIHGTNPQFLIDKIMRMKIYNDLYYKEQLFALDAESIIEKAAEIDHIGGSYGANKDPCPFLCLTLKLLQIQPSKDVINEYIKDEDFKYLRALGLFYVRLIESPENIYKKLDPYLVDNRKLVCLNEPTLSEGKYTKYKIIHMDEFVDSLLQEEILFGIALPHLPKRHHLGEEYLYKSPIEEEYDEIYGKQEKKKDESMSDEDKQESSSDDDAQAQPARSPQDVEMKKEEPTSKPKKDENSIEYWNEQRAKLGMKPLKEKEPTEVDSRQVRHPPQSSSRDTELYKLARRRDQKRQRRHSSSSSSPASNNKKKDETSVGYWNEQRAKLGMKPLKDGEEQLEDRREKKHKKKDKKRDRKYRRDRSDSYERRRDRKRSKKHKSRRHRSRSRSSSRSDRGDKKKKDETSVEYWNELRAKIGMKKLKDE